MDEKREQWILCPVCGKGKVLHALPGTRAVELEVFCRRCRQRSVLDVGGPAEDQRAAARGETNWSGLKDRGKENRDRA